MQSYGTVLLANSHYPQIAIHCNFITFFFFYLYWD